jgi:CrcB protein
VNLELVIVGAAIGAPLRYLLDRFVQRIHSTAIPLGTLTVNLVASVVLGAVTGLAAGGSASHHVQLLVGTGFCATLSTYSTFSYETVRVAEEDGAAVATFYVCLSVLGGLGAAALGVWVS